MLPACTVDHKHVHMHTLPGLVIPLLLWSFPINIIPAAEGT